MPLGKFEAQLRLQSSICFRFSQISVSWRLLGVNELNWISQRLDVLLWRCDNGVDHVNKVKLHRTYLVLGWVFTFYGSTIQVFIQATQPGHPSVSRCNEYWRWFRSPLGKKWRVLSSSGLCHQDCWHTGCILASSKVRGDELPCYGSHGLCVNLLLRRLELASNLEQPQVSSFAL